MIKILKILAKMVADNYTVHKLMFILMIQFVLAAWALLIGSDFVKLLAKYLFLFMNVATV